MRKKIVLSILLLAGFQFVAAQRHEFGLALGSTNYRGEMSDVINITKPDYGFGVFYRYNLNPEWSFRANFFFGEAQDNDAGSSSSFEKARNHSFKTGIVEFSAVAEYNFLDMGRDIKATYRWTPYIFGGLGYMRMQPKNNIQPAYSLESFVIPMGGGVKFAITQKINLGIEMGARFTFTDYIDDIGVSVNKASKAPRDPKYYTGNPNDYDLYFFTGVNISFVIENKLSICPVKIPN
jgi:opacity protein-like surface antigen